MKLDLKYISDGQRTRFQFQNDICDLAGEKKRISIDELQDIISHYLGYLTVKKIEETLMYTPHKENELMKMKMFLTQVDRFRKIMASKYSELRDVNDEVFIEDREGK